MTRGMSQLRNHFFSLHKCTTQRRTSTSQYYIHSSLITLNEKALSGRRTLPAVCFSLVIFTHSVVLLRPARSYSMKERDVCHLSFHSSLVTGCKMTLFYRLRSRHHVVEGMIICVLYFPVNTVSACTMALPQTKTYWIRLKKILHISGVSLPGMCFRLASSLKTECFSCPQTCH